LEFAKVVSGCAVRMLVRDVASPAGNETTQPSACGSPEPASGAETNLAKERLRESFVYVGITEEWDLSICLLHAVFGGDCLASDFVDSNPGQASNTSSSMYDISVLEGYQDLHDGAVYAEARAIFQEQMQRYGVSQETCQPCFQQATSNGGPPEVPPAVALESEVSQRQQPELKEEHLFVPIGHTLISTDPDASAAFLIKYYSAKRVQLPECNHAVRAAVQMPPSLSGGGPSPLYVFVHDGSLPAGALDFEALVSSINVTLTQAHLGLTTYSFFLDNHDGIKDRYMRKAAEYLSDIGMPVAGYSHGPGSADPLVQIPHTMKTLQVHEDTTPKSIVEVSMMDDCRQWGGSGDMHGWWKSTFFAADPEAAASFAVTILGALRIDAPYESNTDVLPTCTAGTWVRLPGTPSEFQLHFVRLSTLYQKFPGEMDAYTQQVRSLRNLSAGTLDHNMYNTLMLDVHSLDPFVQRLKMLSMPVLASRTGPQGFALFLDFPENDIIIQLRSEHLTVEGVQLAEIGLMRW